MLTAMTQQIYHNLSWEVIIVLEKIHYQLGKFVLFYAEVKLNIEEVIAQGISYQPHTF